MANIAAYLCDGQRQKFLFLFVIGGNRAIADMINPTMQGEAAIFDPRRYGGVCP